MSNHMRCAIFSTVATMPCTAPKTIQSGRIIGRKTNHCKALEWLNFFGLGVFIKLAGYSTNILFINA